MFTNCLQGWRTGYTCAPFDNANKRYETAEKT
jgi:hypothetical protein